MRLLRGGLSGDDCGCIIENTLKFSQLRSLLRLKEQAPSVT